MMEQALRGITQFQPPANVETAGQGTEMETVGDGARGVRGTAKGHAVNSLQEYLRLSHTSVLQSPLCNADLEVKWLIYYCRKVVLRLQESRSCDRSCFVSEHRLAHRPAKVGRSARRDGVTHRLAAAARGLVRRVGS
ncbi:hypothetical protein EVAR_83713_1 [Eumeta japonica]|uniref:Uncharacterized protein n=1 Tax=Eumeta variegata TaxID=151549 RepID=A0A4C1WC02_EUMVA|nr:hypothetical protein EVAR_83713_1 [Eumeta japonica]